MARQVKIFKSSKPDVLEKNVNQWLEENPNIKITQRLQSESLSSFIQGDRPKYIWNCTITIFYEESKPVSNEIRENEKRKLWKAMAEKPPED